MSKRDSKSNAGLQLWAERAGELRGLFLHVQLAAHGKGSFRGTQHTCLYAEASNGVNSVNDKPDSQATGDTSQGSGHCCLLSFTGSAKGRLLKGRGHRKEKPRLCGSPTGQLDFACDLAYPVTFQDTGKKSEVIGRT